VKEFLEFVIRRLVDFPDEVIVREVDGGRTAYFKLRMNPNDVGKVIGRHGQTIQALRGVLSAAAAKHDRKAQLEILEDPAPQA